MASSSQHRCVFVGNIPYDATEEQLVQICEEVGPVVSFRLVIDRETGKPKGYGFCEYKDEETALSARRNLQGYEINGRQLRVDFAENDKNADRNRDQGRGGPGLIANLDAQKHFPAPSAPIRQPIGFQLAESAAAVMGRHLGGDQTGGISNVYGQNGPGNDALTHCLAKMSRDQLHEVMSEMKALATQNAASARKLLQTFPQLSKALFQAQIILGMVTPQMMAHILQASSASVKPQVLDGGQKLLIPSHSVPIPTLQNVAPIGSTGMPSGVHVEQTSNFIQSSSVTHTISLPSHVTPVQPQFNIPQSSNSQFQLQGTTLGASGVLAEKSAHAPTLGASGVLAEKSAHAPIGILPPKPPLVAAQSSASFQPHLLQQAGAIPGKTGIHSQPTLPQNGILQQPVLSQPPASQFPPEIESDLLQQVMSLTPEQMSSLPAEQRQQVLQLQQILRS